MADARCSCGALTLALAGSAKLVVACHCLDCQRRTGSAFGLGAFYPVDAVTVSGPAREFVREGESGAQIRAFFCPTCGSTLYWKAERLPAMIGVAVGALADPDYPAPARSVFERSKHAWVQIDHGAEHFAAGSAARTPD
jgi:hypothetical protein